MNKNDQINISIDRLGINGEGVGHWQGYTIFVEGALPGEHIVVEIYERRKNFARARLVKILQNSSSRVSPPCALFGTCGGCQLMHLDYEKQLEQKRQRIVDAFERIGKLPNVVVASCEPSPSPLAYRNKIQLPCEPKNHGLRMGLYARHSHKLIDVEHCYIHCDLGEKAYAQVRNIVQSYSLGDELRHVLIKTAVFQSQVLVTLVTKNEHVPKLTDLARDIMSALPEIRGVVQNINNLPGNNILSKKFRTLAGQSFIREKILGLEFKVSSASFFQVNPAQAQNLYEKTRELADLQGHEVVLDAFCGVGTLSLVLAGQAKSVVGVECVSEAIADAEENAKQNNIKNVKFVRAKTEDFISTLAHVDVAVLNPPRKGCEPSVLESLCTLAPQRILYISCDPATLARDLAIICQNGYEIDAVKPFDMFPQTAHVECLVRLVLKNRNHSQH